MNYVLSDDQLVLLAQTVADKVGHFKSSPDTIKMFQEMDKKHETTDKKVDKLGFILDLHINDNKHSNEEVLRILDEIKVSLDTSVKDRNKALDSKAGKWVEKPIIGFISILVAGVLYAMLRVVLKS